MGPQSTLSSMLPPLILCSQVNFKQQKLRLSAFDGMPDFSLPLLSRMSSSDARLQNYTALELANLEYTPERGSCIEFHRDDTWIWGNRLISISLLSASVITLWDESAKALFFVPLPRCSLLCMADDVRYKLKHAVLSEHITSRRIALTMREADTKFYAGDLFEQSGREMLERARRVIPMLPVF